MRRLVIAVVCLLTVFNAVADVTRASRWIDRVVLTSDGELLGRVEDFALQDDSLGVAYVVVSVGSYLIDDNLIAVTPDALRESSEGDYLVIPTDALVDAPRFDNDSWPDEAQVVAPPISAPAPKGTPPPPSIAEIVGADRKMSIDKDGQRSVTAITQSRAPTTAEDGIQRKTHREGIFEQDSTNETLNRFDANRDGYLSRREIAPYLKPGLSFSDYDSDGNGGLDAFELKVMKELQ